MTHMQRTRIKICGITRAEDARAAASAGADAIGMVFYARAGRNISIDRAREIIAVLPPFVTPVGLFVDAEPDEILDTAMQLGLRTVQLNGSETPSHVAELEGLRVLKAVRVNRETFARALQTWQADRPANLIGIVLEPDHTAHAGGSGVANDWTTIHDALRDSAPTIPIIAAGGLTPQSVADVVRAIRPYAVDVSSGVESTLGMKSEEKIDAFIQAVREAQ